MTMEAVGIGKLVLLAVALAPMPWDARYSPIPEDRYHDDGSCWDRQAGAPGRCSCADALHDGMCGNGSRCPPQ